jgi:hypothetical protein
MLPPLELPELPEPEPPDAEVPSPELEPPASAPPEPPPLDAVDDSLESPQAATRIANIAEAGARPTRDREKASMEERPPGLAGAVPRQIPAKSRRNHGFPNR